MGWKYVRVGANKAYRENWLPTEASECEQYGFNIEVTSEMTDEGPKDVAVWSLKWGFCVDEFGWAHDMDDQRNDLW